MKNILLKELRIKNFKGIIEKVVTFDGSTNIFGANETGKSTTYTAFNWLLTGKDEFDRADYEIKNTSRKELNSQAHEVEALLLVDNKEVKLKRAYLEKWTKPKGQSRKVFDGHFTDFYYNDVPCNATEYAAKIEAIIPSKIIKLLTNPYFFNSLKWDEQRRGLLAIAGNITDTEIFDSIATPKNDYGTLIMVLNSGKSIDEYKKELAAKKLLLKKAAVEYEPRIDEAKRNKPEPEDWSSLEQQKAIKLSAIAEIEELLNDASKSLTQKQKGIMEKQKLKHAKETDLSILRQKVKTEYLAQQNTGSSDLDAIGWEINNINHSLSQLIKSTKDSYINRESYQNGMTRRMHKVNQLRADWDKINSEKFYFDDNKCECPTCKQSLPADQIEQKKAELLNNFNDSVMSGKKAKVEESNQLKAEIKQLEENISAINAQIVIDETHIKIQTDTLNQLTEKLASLKNSQTQKPAIDVNSIVDQLMETHEEALNLAVEIATLNEQITVATKELDTSDSDLKKSVKANIELEVKELEKKLAVRESIEKTDKRIQQLETEEVANAQAIADIEMKEFEIETYTRAKMDILEKRVNGKFRLVSFRLFKKLINGGIEETCVCEYKNVPYPTLNTAARLLAGLDILETLSQYYGIRAPVFCDCRESVTFIPPTESQIISLFVSAADKEIRIEAA